MFALVIWVCVAAATCAPPSGDFVFVGKPMDLRKCQVEAIHILNAMPDLPAGQSYQAACAGQNRIGRKV